jgi:hypothetical protein
MLNEGMLTRCIYHVCTVRALHVCWAPSQQLIWLARVVLACPYITQDAEYAAAGATIVDAGEAHFADVVLRVRPPPLSEVDKLKQGAV